LKTRRSTVGWLVAGLIFGGTTLFLAGASGGDPISAGMISFALQASSIAAFICVAGLIVSILR
jgi:hypothetical protein